MNSCELMLVAINPLLFFQCHPVPSITSVGVEGLPKLEGGDRALEEEEG